MNFKLTTRHATTVSANGENPELLLAEIETVCRRLNWHITYTSPYGIMAHTSVDLKYEEITIRIENDTIHILSNSTGGMHDWGKNEKNTTLFTNTFNEIRGKLPIEEVATITERLKAIFPVPEEDILNPVQYNELNKKGNALLIFLPSKGYFITPILLALNILVFAIMAIAGVDVINPEAESIYNWGGNWGPATLGGQWWRLLTCAFIHIGILHLLMNMYALVYVGMMLEPLLGKARFTTAYMLTAITSSLLSLNMHPEIISAGASGAIFGLFGVFIALLTTNIIDKASKTRMLPTMGIYVMYNLLYGMKEGVDNAGHIGGLVGGLVIGYGLVYSVKHYEWKGIKYTTISLLTVGVIILAFFSLNVIKDPNQKKRNDFAAYQEKMKHFADLESMALGIYNFTDTSKERRLYEIKDRGIYYWNQCEDILNEVDKLDLPYEAYKTNNLIKDYCALRKDSYELMYKKIAEETDVYDKRIAALDSSIASIVDEMQQENNK